MITLEFINVLMGLMLVGVAIANLRDRTNARRFNNTVFWGLWAFSFLFGSYVSSFVNGLVVIAMVLAMVVGGLGPAPPESTSRDERMASAARWGSWLFVPALTIPAVTLAGTFGFAHLSVRGTPLVDPRQVTLISLGVAIVAAVIVAIIMLRPPASAPMNEGRRLMDAVGWAAVLPQTLAALGAMFALAGVGPIVAHIIDRWIPLTTPFSAVAAYVIGMALFTTIMGNAFAAFPVMTAGIGLPLIAHQFGGNVAVMAAVGMVSGFCGTLSTPMAANFNIVPAALLELPDQNGVIKVQIPTAVLLLAANIMIMYVFVYRA